MTVVDHVTCLGCGLACDDIAVTVTAGRITDARNACPLGVAWFGDGAISSGVRVRGADTDASTALREAATLLMRAKRPLIYLAAELSSVAQREAVALADALGAALDTLTASTAGFWLIAAQRRGRAGATFGELRNRADVIVFWGIDPARGYPRLRSRYLTNPAGIIAVDIGDDAGPPDAAERFAFPAAQELAAAALMRAAVLGRVITVAPSGGMPGGDRPMSAALAPIGDKPAALAARLVAAKYVALIADAEPRPGRDEGRAEALLALAEALNGPTRCALVTMRAGGNRVGAESVLTWQTGYPMAVDFARGAPRYDPDARVDPDVVLIVGAAGSIPSGSFAKVSRIVIGPRATATDAAVAIDTGMAGIHDGGTAVRADDIPLPLRPPLAGTIRETAGTVGALTALVRAR